MEVTRRVYTLGDFRRELERQYRHDLRAMNKVNIQSDEALDMLNRCLPRNLMVKKLFHEDEEGVSVMDCLG